MGGDDEPVGLQNERTALAWRRTASACLIAGALLARNVGGWAGVVLLVAVAAGAGAVDRHAHRRYRLRAEWLAAERAVSSPEDVVALAALVIGMSAVALGAVLAG